MVLPSLEPMLENLWEEAQGDIELDGLKISYDVRPNMTKRDWINTMMGTSKEDFAIDKKGKIIMINLNLI